MISFDHLIIKQKGDWRNCWLEFDYSSTSVWD